MNINVLTTEALEKSSGDTKIDAGIPIFKGLNSSIEFHVCVFIKYPNHF